MMTEAPAAPSAVAELVPPAGDIVAAQAKKSELMADKAWGARYLAGGAEERSTMAALNATIAASGSENPQDAVAGAFMVERARELGVSDAVLDQVANRPRIEQEEYERVARHKRELLSDKTFVDQLNQGNYDARRKLFLANVVLSSPIKPAA